MATKKPATKTAAKATATQNTSVPGSTDDSTTGAGQPASGAEASGNSAATSAVSQPESSPSGGKAEPDAKKTISDPVAKQLIVIARAEGFRRAGRAWSREAQTVNVGDFSEAQVKALLAEPMLDVAVVVEKEAD